MRTATIERNTAETQIKLWIDLDGTGQYEICTGCGFLDHMLNLFARHGRFDLRAECRGDTQVTITTRWRIWALRWAGPLPLRWGICGALPATAA